MKLAHTVNTLKSQFDQFGVFSRGVIAVTRRTAEFVSHTDSSVMLVKQGKKNLFSFVLHKVEAAVLL